MYFCCIPFRTFSFKKKRNRILTQNAHRYLSWNNIHLSSFHGNQSFRHFLHLGETRWAFSQRRCHFTITVKQPRNICPRINFTYISKARTSHIRTKCIISNVNYQICEHVNRHSTTITPQNLSDNIDGLQTNYSRKLFLVSFHFNTTCWIHLHQEQRVGVMPFPSKRNFCSNIFELELSCEEVARLCFWDNQDCFKMPYCCWWNILGTPSDIQGEEGSPSPLTSF